MQAKLLALLPLPTGSLARDRRYGWLASTGRPAVTDSQRDVLPTSSDLPLMWRTIKDTQLGGSMSMLVASRPSRPVWRKTRQGRAWPPFGTGTCHHVRRLC